MIDPTLVIRKINLISQDFKEIVELSRKSLQEFLASRVDEVLAERYLERMIGRMIDINYHLITESGLPPPTDYYQSFLQLERLGVLPPRLRADSRLLRRPSEPDRPRVRRDRPRQDPRSASDCGSRRLAVSDTRS
jgi:uncharacterized protein YutE (UPF0331/DUF86 family)